MIDVSKLVTLEDDTKYYIINEVKIKNEKFLIGVRVVNDEIINEFKFFIEINKNNEKFLESVEDKDLIKFIVDAYMLNNI